MALSNGNPKIKVTAQGPYVVSGPVALRKAVMVPDASGITLNWEDLGEIKADEPMYLCRCGHSANKPFCDNSHLRVGFEGSETAANTSYEELAETVSGPELILTDARPLCSSARFCGRAGGVRKLIMDSEDPESRKTAIQEVHDCPSGALRVFEKKTGISLEQDLAPSIHVSEDPGRLVSGPLAIRGRIDLESASGALYESRNRMALCRCGQSSNKPFCDGSHIRSAFFDGDAGVVRSRAKQEILSVLKKHLQTAVLLEYSTLPPYLTAYWSIHGDSTHAEKARKTILSVIQEEMLHMGMVCNILNALGARPVLNDKDQLPVYPCPLPGHSKVNNVFLVHLNRCCPESLTNFIQIELPAELYGTPDHEDGWCTIGEFYDEIEDLLKSEFLDDNDFSFGNQLSNSFNPGNGTLYTVGCRADALNALEEIIDQGEGHSGKLYDGDHQLTHYWRFMAIRDLMNLGIWKFEEEVKPLAKDPHISFFNAEARHLNSRFNSIYSEMLDSMHLAFSQSEPSLDEAIGIMHRLKRPALELMKIPLEGKAGNASPTFQYIPAEERTTE